MSRRDDLVRFYALLDRLASCTGGARLLGSLPRGSEIPRRGIYFFFESGEMRSDSGHGPRVVRSAPMRFLQAPHPPSGSACASTGGSSPAAAIIAAPCFVS
jgi:hypothetical protein